MSKNKNKNAVAEARKHLETALEEFKSAVTILQGVTREYMEIADGVADIAKKQEHKKTSARKQAKTAPGKPAKQAAPAANAEKAADIPRRTSASVRQTAHELTLNLGAYPVQALAEDDAKDLLGNPMVFWYRPIQFPDPRRHRVQPRIDSARVVKREGAKFSRSPWTVNVTISIAGEDKRCEAWGAGVLSKNKGEQE